MSLIRHAEEFLFVCMDEMNCAERVEISPRNLVDERGGYGKGKISYGFLLSELWT